ncbi:MAG: glucose-6-phosphate dehydrogenase assembly protein OpcA [Candidatus Lambdaproteobacteria bacterium]|nr:glucose-6-phosphate dehydrogenase assembly protein OpcA [Candidatus Lambdaproteobacteria bacterium]
MAQTVSCTRAGDLLHVTRSGPVEIAAIDQTWARLWREALSVDDTLERAPTTRACLWNLLVMGDGGQMPAHDNLTRHNATPSRDRLQALLDEVTRSVPARVIRLETAALDSGREVEAHIACNGLLRNGAALVCAEQVTLRGNGADGARHFPSLVRALKVPDLPVALLWLHELPRKSRLLGELVGLSNRVVVDTHSTLDEMALPALQALSGSLRSLTDIGWMRITPVRYMLASLFDAPGHAELLRRVERIRIEAAPAGRPAAFLLAGWLLGQCGYSTVKAVPVPDAQTVYRWNVRAGDGAFPLDFGEREAEGGVDHLLSVEIHAGGTRFALSQVDIEHVCLDSPLHEGHRLALHGWDTAELLVAALGLGHADALYPKALALAAQLADAEAWNR